jgi:hypothetical protein
MATDPDPQHWLLLPLLDPRGETHSLAGEGTGPGGPNSDKGTRSSAGRAAVCTGTLAGHENPLGADQREMVPGAVP